MNLKISASTDRFTDLPWPSNVPLPPTGSHIAMIHNGEEITFVVDRCEFDLKDPAGEAGTVCIRGHHHTPGSV